MAMRIGFIGFGEVSSTLSQFFKDKVEVQTCVKGRSEKTKKIAKKLGVKIYKDYKDLVKNSDIVISAVTPFSALDVAKKYGKYVKGIYVDVNNVSPLTKHKILKYIDEEKFVDCAIIGRIKRKFKMICSGKNANKLKILEKFGVPIEVIGSKVGEASTLKMLRSLYTKSLAAILLEVFSVANKLGLIDELLEILEETEGKKFVDLCKSRVVGSFIHSRRRYEEICEIEKFILSHNLKPIMIKCTKNMFKHIEDVDKDYIKKFK